MTSSYEQIKDLNKKTNIKPENIGTESYWFSLKNQIKRIQEELDETLLAVEERNLLEILDGGCDLEVTVGGFNFLSGLNIEEALKRVHYNNTLKYTTDYTEAASAMTQYFDPSVAAFYANVQSSVVDGVTYYSVHRDSDNKFLKLLNHPKVDLSDLIPSVGNYH